jgi:hypothetical protein
MKLALKSFCLSALLVACGGCAHTAGGNGEYESAYADANSSVCEANAGKQVYRNPYLRTRRVGQQACAD